MVRGTNKRIIEINDTQNPYFERAVLYLKDTQEASSKKAMETQAQRFLSSLAAPLLRGGRISLLQMNGKRWFAALKLLLSAAAGGLLTFFGGAVSFKRRSPIPAGSVFWPRSRSRLVPQAAARRWGRRDRC